VRWFGDKIFQIMDKVRPLIFIAGVAVFAAVLFGVFLLKANPPADITQKKEQKREYTYGAFIEAPLRAAKGELLSFKFDLNRRATLNGKWSTENYKPRLNFFVVTGANFELMKSGAEFESVTTTGVVPGGKITRKMEPGLYYVVFDNRDGAEDIRIQEADFSID
jgi:hypothetical protein